jgi:hypothetical protein
MQTHDVEGDPGGQAARAAPAREATGEATSAREAGGPPGSLGPAAVRQLQRSVGNAAVASVLGTEKPEESPVKDVVRSAGTPLDRDTRSLMEARLGHDFSDVHVHTDTAAAASAKSVQAQAYTVDNHIVFGEGRYQPGSPETTRTLAHELTHVVQQRNGPVDGTPAAGGIRISDPSDRFEQEAERSADAAVAAGPAPAAVQRQEAEGDEEEVQELALQRQEGEGEEEEVQELALQREEGEGEESEEAG